MLHLVGPLLYYYAQLCFGRQLIFVSYVAGSLSCCPLVAVFGLAGPSRVICRYQVKDGTYLDCPFWSTDRLIFQAVSLRVLLEWSAIIQLLFWFIIWWLACTHISVERRRQHQTQRNVTLQNLLIISTLNTFKLLSRIWINEPEISLRWSHFYNQIILSP